MKYIQTIILMLTFLALFGCDGIGQTANVGEQFTLKSNESAKIAGANIEITVNRIGRKWLADGGGESLDFSFSVVFDGKIKSYSSPLPDMITAGDYKIEVIKTEPFGDGYAIFVVTKNDSAKNNSIENNSVTKNDSDITAAKFVESFGWHIDESVAPTKIPIEFQKNFDNLPFYHYQFASQQSGVDMSPLVSRKVEMLKYTLREKQTDRGKDYTVFAHLIVENSKVVGAWRTDSSDSAPGIYSFVKKKI